MAITRRTWLRSKWVSGCLLVLAVSACSAPATGAPDSPLSVAGWTVSADLTQAVVSLGSRGPVVVSGPAGHTEVRGDRIVVPLPFEGADGVQSVRLDVSGDGIEGYVALEYYPRSHYESIGSDLPGILLLETSLPRTRSLEEDFAVSLPALPSDATSPNATRWNAARADGVIPALGSSLADGVLALYRDLDASNDPAVGRLCDETLSGYDTLAAIRARSCFVWCTGYAKILRGFLRSAGIATRTLSLAPDWQTLPNGVGVLSSEGHATDELWDRDHWAWIGPTSRALRAFGPDGRSLSTAGLIAALGDPGQRARISFTRLDPTTGRWATRAYGDQDEQFRIDLDRFFTADKRLVVLDAPISVPPLVPPLLLFAVAALAVSAISFARRRQRSSPRG